MDPRGPSPLAYIPCAASPAPTAAILMRSSAGTTAAVSALREAVAAIDPDLPVRGVGALDDRLSDEFRLVAVFSSMFGMFAAAALGIAAVGLYAVATFAVTQRTREVGLRIALGARARHVWWVVTRRAAFQVACGLVIGLAGALAAGQILGAVLTAVSSRDPVTLIAVPAVMIAVALLACVMPARRAMWLDPAVALRSE